MAKKYKNKNYFYESLTSEQEKLKEALLDPMVKVIVVNAPAGTGKTTLVTWATKLMQRDLVYVFPNVAEEELGYTPGGVFSKYYKYLSPLIDALEEIDEVPEKVIYNEDAGRDPIASNVQGQALENGTIWVYPKPHCYLRGSNLKGNKVIVIDESQNYTKKQLKKIITRVHDSAKLVLIGHMGQCDLADNVRSGFPDYIEFYRHEPYARVIELTKCFRGVIASGADKV